MDESQTEVFLRDLFQSEFSVRLAGTWQRETGREAQAHTRKEKKAESDTSVEL